MVLCTMVVLLSKLPNPRAVQGVKRPMFVERYHILYATGWLEIAATQTFSISLFLFDYLKRWASCRVTAFRTVQPVLLQVNRE